MVRSLFPSFATVDGDDAAASPCDCSFKHVIVLYIAIHARSLAGVPILTQPAVDHCDKPPQSSAYYSIPCDEDG